jgi:4-amino-4-deoxy-L-arabinose transferase-like glycosyltransferase
VLYFWRVLGTSELWLRLPSVFAGVAFCWMLYKWLSKSAGELNAIIALLFAAFLPPVVVLAAEVRQYALLLAFLAGALYFLDEAFRKNSLATMAAFSLCLYLAMLSHYSAFLFAGALGVYASIRIVYERSRLPLSAVWAAGQLGALVLAIVLYKTHLSKLGAGDFHPALQGWMSEHFLRHSYLDPAHDNPVVFLLGHSFGVFQYFFGQPAVGDVMGLLFVVGVVLLLSGQGFPGGRTAARCLGLLLILPFAMACIASLAHVYPYGGTRHVAFLIIPAIAGISVAIARLAAGRWARGIAIASLIIVACLAFGKPRQPWMTRSDQNRAHMAAALEFIRSDVNASDLLFTDYQSDLILGHYLCGQKPISFDSAPVDFEQFSCAGHRVVSKNFKRWMFLADSFTQDWQRLIQAYGLKSGDTVWIFQAGWNANLPDDLRKQIAEFHDLQFESFGNNIKIFKMKVA